MRDSSTRDELNTRETVYRLWHFLVKYVTPVAVIIVFLNVIGVIHLK
jgi:NSS family neurotransmitter:Na+ symporter